MNFINKVYSKSKLTFTLILIGVYIVICSLCDSFSETLGIEKVVTAPVLAVLSVCFYLWLRKIGLSKEYGLCSFKGNLKGYLYFIPLVILLTANLWNGWALNLGLFETVLYILSMLCVGFLEEVIFRGFLFKSILPDGFKIAVTISSVTFGVGHIVNLFNGAELLPTVLQILYASAIGFLFTVMFYRGKSLWPCILTHGIFNSLSVFSVEADTAISVTQSVILCIIPLIYAVWILKRQ